MAHKILDHDTQKNIYRSAVRPKKSPTPNHRLAPHGGEVSSSSDASENEISSGSPLGSQEGSSPEQKAPTVFIRSRDEENPSGSKPMPTFEPVTSLVEHSYFHLRRLGRGIEPRLPDKLLKLLTRTMAKG